MFVAIQKTVLLTEFTEPQPMFVLKDQDPPPQGKVLVCHKCGEVWGKVDASRRFYGSIRDDLGVVKDTYRAVTCLCEGCGNGSLLQAGCFMYYFNEPVGRQVLVREYELAEQTELWTPTANLLGSVEFMSLTEYQVHPQKEKEDA